MYIYHNKLLREYYIISTQLNMIRIAFQYTLLILQYLFIQLLYISQENMQELDEYLIAATQDQSEKFASVYQKINLPKTRHLNPYSQRMFQFEQNSAEKFDTVLISSEIKEARDLLTSEIEKKCQVFENTHYKFIFPDSKFRDVPVGESNSISYEQKVEAEDEDTFRDRLSAAQLKQIAEKGQFEVMSGQQNVKIPYVWKINENIFISKKNRINIWENGLANCFQLLQTGIIFLKKQIPKQITTIIYLPAKLFSLIVGRRKLTSIWSPDCNRQVVKDFWSDIMMNELKDENEIIGQEFLQLLYVPFESKFLQSYDPQTSEYARKNREIENNKYHDKVRKIGDIYGKLTNIQQKFQLDWMKIRKRVLKKVDNQMEVQPQGQPNISDQESKLATTLNSKEQATLKRFQQQKFSIYQAHLKQHLPKQFDNFSSAAIQAIIHLIIIICWINNKIQQKNYRLADINQKIRIKVKKQHTIKSRLQSFLTYKVNKEYKTIEQKINNDFYQQLLNSKEGNKDLLSLLSNKYESIYEKYVMLRKDYTKRTQDKKKEIKQLYVPSRVFRTTYMVLPPYQIKGQNNYYHCIKQKEMTIDTSTNFWKFKLYFMRMKSWTINCLVSLIALAWVGPFGFRCLFGVSQFNYDEYCDYQTGSRKYQKRKPFFGRFIQVLSGVHKSRQHFQSLPDRGLFGKNVSRYFNYIQCYVFRLIIVGIIGTLITYPIIICVLATLCVVLIITFWVWVPVIMIVCYLFNILVFQFESSFIPRGIVIRSVPLVSLALLLVRCVLISVAAVLNAIIISPLLAGLYFIFLVIQRLFRTFTDIFMLFLFKKLGRTPSKDSVIARKVSGPGMSRSYFFSIMQEDVYVLTQCQLEKIFMVKFVQHTKSKIQKFLSEYLSLMSYVLKPFGYSEPNFNQYYNQHSSKNRTDIIRTNVATLENHFNQQVGRYNNRYPRYPSRVRFTQQEIDLYFENSVKIVKNFVQKQRIQKWIFDENHLIHEDYDELTRILWIRIFNCGEEIFQPLQQIDSRFTVEDIGVSNSSKMRKSVGSVMKALEGQITLNKDRIKFTPAKRSLLSKDVPINYLSLIHSLHSSNSLYNVSLSLENPTSILVPQRNLEQLKKYDTYRRQQIRKSYEKVIQQ